MTIRNQRTFLIDRLTLGGVSTPFDLIDQVTVQAMGLHAGDEVHLEIVLLSDMTPPACACPPGRPTLPAVIDAVPLSCCGEPVVLSRDQPFVVLDAPQGSKLRARLETTMQDTQVVWFQNTATPNVNDRLRGCPCEDAA